jgi:hypothetical protein
MNAKTLLATISGLSALTLVATCGPALAFGHHGHGHHHGDMEYGLLAHAAGITGEQIHTAFEAAAPTLKADFQSLKTAKTAMDACIIGGTCTSSNGQIVEIAAYTNAKSKLTQDKLGVWQGLFAANGATKDNAAVTLKNSLDSLNAQKHALLKPLFSSANGYHSVTPPTSQQ